MKTSIKTLGLGLSILMGGFGLAAAKDAAQLTIQVSASVPTSCEISNQNSFTQIGPQSFVIGSISRFCNTAHDIRIGHSAAAAVGQISIGGASTPLAQGVTLVVANSAPTYGTDQIILSGVDNQTAQQVSASLMAQITPSGF